MSMYWIRLIYVEKQTNAKKSSSYVEVVFRTEQILYERKDGTLTTL